MSEEEAKRTERCLFANVYARFVVGVDDPIAPRPIIGTVSTASSSVVGGGLFVRTNELTLTFKPCQALLHDKELFQVVYYYFEVL
jgi:hypothetical protein